MKHYTLCCKLLLVLLLLLKLLLLLLLLLLLWGWRVLFLCLSLTIILPSISCLDLLGFEFGFELGSEPKLEFGSFISRWSRDLALLMARTVTKPSSSQLLWLFVAVPMWLLTDKLFCLSHLLSFGKKKPLDLHIIVINNWQGSDYCQFILLRAKRVGR